MNLNTICEIIKKFFCENFGLFSSFSEWEQTHDKFVCDKIDWSIIGSWVVLFLILLGIFIYLLRYNRIFEYLSRYILFSAFTVWLGGVLIYIVGFYSDKVNGLSVVLRAIISSFKMFVVSHDLARIPSFLQNDSLYMTCFSIIHFLAAFITFLFVFKMLGYKIKSSLNILKYRCMPSENRVVHLFWGVNEASCLLAEDIHKNYPTEKIIFIDIDEEGEDGTQKKFTLSYITNIITIKNDELVRLDKIGVLIDHCYNGPAALNGTDVNDIFGRLNLKSIGNIIQKCSKSYFYFLSDDEAKNIAGALNLQQDLRLQMMKHNKPDIYVHARRDANNEVFDHYSQYDENTKRMRIKIVDFAYLSMTSLKEDERALPVNCVEIDKTTGVVTSPFTALIVGFGGNGQEAFKFLYEYSAFIGPDMKKSPFKCYAIDEKMNNIAGYIREKMPAIGEDELSLIQASVDSEDFWTKVRAIINDLNYVVIALNNDAIGLSLAVNMFKYALKNRPKNRPMLKIVLRCYSRSNEKRMTEVANNLNKSVEGYNVEILLCGEGKKLYCCKTILSDSTLVKAKEFNKVYENSELTADEQWEKNFGKDKILKLMNKEKMSRYHAIYDINRRIAQNISNSLHYRTKMILMGFGGKEESSERLKLYYGYVQSRREQTVNYNCGEIDAQLLLNMAMVEHERWIASHKLMGYIYAPENDFVQKCHKCMDSWERLGEVIRSYDCNVVDTTIKMAYQAVASLK